mmetsp:Transcript_23765/g.50888  ORF Transcript_23765/g.50888 Transcript_23765/m.50888 type:complete len:81 (-) Transcript_23765:1210-1452(-)
MPSFFFFLPLEQGRTFIATPPPLSAGESPLFYLDINNPCHRLASFYNVFTPSPAFCRINFDQDLSPYFSNSGTSALLLSW